MNTQAVEFDKYESQTELWVNSRMVTVDVCLVSERVEKLLPFGIKLTEMQTGTLFIVDYIQPNFTAPYREAALLVHVKTLFGEGLHCCWMTVDDDTAMVYGRELLGFPKKMADIKFQEDQPTIRASVSRRGTDVLTMNAVRKTVQENPDAVFDKKFFNVGAPGAICGFRYYSREIFAACWLGRSILVRADSNAPRKIALLRRTLGRACSFSLLIPQVQEWCAACSICLRQTLLTD